MKPTLLSLLLLGAGVLSADTVYSNLANTLIAGGTDVVGSSEGSYQTAGGMFQSPGSYTLSDVIVGLSSDNAPSSTVDVELYSDAYVPSYYSHGVEYFIHEPGTDLGNLGVLTATSTPTLYTVTPSATFILSANTYYWVNLLPADSTTLVTWDEQSVTNDQALRVDGTAAAAAPEPATVGLLGLTLSAIALLRRRKV